jgi:hypothetical protein
MLLGGLVAILSTCNSLVGFKLDPFVVSTLVLMAIAAPPVKPVPWRCVKAGTIEAALGGGDFEVYDGGRLLRRA